MKRTRKIIGSLLLSVCMVFTMLPTVAFAEEGDTPSGTREITAEFTDTNFLAEVRTALGKEVDDPIYDTDKFASVTSLKMNNKGIESLAGIKYFTALTTLDCSSNQLTELDVSNNTALTYLSCKFNLLSELDMSKNTALEKLYCYGNHLTTLDVSNNTALTTLWCQDNQLSALDVSNNTALIELYCNGNQLSALDVSNNTALNELYCYDNQLSTLDVSNNTAFTKLDCNRNQLSALDVSKNTALIGLWCNGNQLSALDVGKNTALLLLDCSGNYMADKSSVNGLDTNRTITFIFDPQNSSTPTDNNITAKFTDANFLAEVRTALGKGGDDPIYDTDKFASVKILIINSKSITSLAGIEYFEKLTHLYCNSNQLTALDVSNNTGLTHLYCNSNQLRALVVSQNTALIELGCSNNQLTVLDVSQNTALTTLYCYSNQLTALDVSQNTALTTLYCYSNQLRALDVSNNAALISLDCASNYMPNKFAVKGLNTSLTTTFTFDPQNTSSTEITGFAAVSNVNAGTAGTATYANADEVIAVLPSSVTANYSGGTIQWPVTSWADTETYDPSTAGSYTFTATLGTEPAGYANSGSYTATVEVVISASGVDTVTITQHPQNITVQEGGTATFTIMADNATSFMWSSGASDAIPNINGRLIDTPDKISGAATATLTIYNVTKAMNGLDFYCGAWIGEDLSTIKTSNSASLTVTEGGGTTEHAITVNSGTADKTSASSGETVTITADSAPNGEQFKEWTVVSGGVTLGNAQTASTTFTMPANAVEVTATYENIPAGVIPVTGVTLNKSSLSLYSNTSPNTAALTTMVAPESATDKSVTWQSSDTTVAIVDASGNVTAVGNGTTTITVTTNDGDYTASCIVTVSTYTNTPTVVNDTSESSNKTVVSYVHYVPTAPEEISRYSYKGREAVEFSAVTNLSKVSLTMNNSIQGKLFFDSIAYVLGDNKIGRTYNIFANQKTEATDQPVTITLSIPVELRKEGRTFKMIGVMKNGMPYVLEDTDADDKTITILTNHFYGFALVYSDK